MIELIKSSNPRILGEYYREKIFINQNINEGLYGCYNTFDVSPELKPIKDTTLLVQLARVLDCDVDDTSFKAYKSSNIIVAWCWDGDGTLYIKPKGNSPIINDDCKKENNWSWSFEYER